ncbi:anti-sigma-factor antagonist [Magnetococcus marinus MC-1]|uniref:Anti-sigma-factor antagonist n=2 Tax=Magnetococcus TaxID=162171 RepID=A0L9P6_MAGMM|nr:anti-sigma-factor antagonist [Magnetococcus marinus MC-1]
MNACDHYTYGIKDAVMFSSEDIEINEVGSTTHLKLNKLLSFEHADLMRQLALNAAKQSCVQVDFSRIAMLDSATLGLLLILKNSLNNGSCNIRLVNLSPDLKRMIKIAAFDSFFELG